MLIEKVLRTSLLDPGVVGALANHQRLPAGSIDYVKTLS